MLSSSNEEAVYAFLDRHIGFLDIVDLIEKALERFDGFKCGSVEDLLELDLEVKNYIKSLIEE